MSDLREDLDAALRMVEPGVAPIEAAVRRGSRLRLRRRVAAAAAALVLAVAVAVGYPAVSHLAAGPAPVPPADRKPAVVTDLPPASGAPKGEIAHGQAGTTAWQVNVDKPGGGMRQCFVAAFDPGAASKEGWDAATPIADSVLDNGGTVGCALEPASQQDPLAFEEANSRSAYLMIASIAADVQYLVVTLADGQAIKAVPVTAYGRRFLAFAAPRGDRVVRATAHLDNGQLLTSVPFTDSVGTPFFGNWRAPGQPLPPTATALLGSGTAGGQHWSVTAYQGPWGTCANSASGRGHVGTSCDSLGQLPGLFAYFGGNFGDSLPYDVAGSAPSAATRVEVTLTDGSSFQVRVVAVGNEKLWAFALMKGQAVKTLTAYSASGKSLGNGECDNCSDR